MKKAFVALILYLVMAGCHKEKTSETGLIGSWRIAKIDSVYMHSPWEDTEEVIHEFSETGEITFLDDSTGFYKNSIRHITCGELDFTWRSVVTETPPIGGRILLNLSFANGESEQSFYTQSHNDSIEFSFKAYCEGVYGGVGLSKYYKFALIRK